MTLITHITVPHVIKFVSAYSNASEAATETLKAFFKITLADCFNDDPRSFATAEYWLYIAMAKSSPKYVWHRDRSVLGRPDPIISRYSMTLLGPPTIVLRPDISFEGMRGTQRPVDVDLDSMPRELINTGQIYRFTTGKINSPVHSTPVFHEDRIFVSVVYYKSWR